MQLAEWRSLMAGGRWLVADGRWLVADGRWRMADGGWPMADGGWPMADGRWPMADGRWPMADGRWPMADGRWPMADDRLSSSADHELLAVDSREGFSRVDRNAERLEMFVERRQVEAQRQEGRCERYAVTAAAQEDGVKGGNEVFGAELDLSLVATEVLAEDGLRQESVKVRRGLA